jgi:hypothetical protein
MLSDILPPKFSLCKGKIEENLEKVLMTKKETVARLQSGPVWEQSLLVPETPRRLAFTPEPAAGGRWMFRLRGLLLL